MLTDIETWLGLDADALPYARSALIVLLAFLVFIVFRRVLFASMQRATNNLSNIWARSLLHSRFLFQASWILPIVAVAVGIHGIADFPATTQRVIEKTLLILLTLACARSLSALFYAIEENYAKLDISHNRPIKGFLQVLTLLAYLAACILIFSIVFNKSPWVFLSGLGAATAVWLLVFRDTILSFVAGIQLTTNRLIKVGDWIEMPQFNADGDVIDIALNSVKVQNWDRTITIIPTHHFLEHSFKNWRGMSESGGRRIKRAVLIDIGSIRFLEEADIQRLGKLQVLEDYLQNKLPELEQHNRQLQNASSVNFRRLTNIGTLRAYLNIYLRHHPRIRQDMTVLVRQLNPEATGLPLEVYAFTNTTKWGEYEAIQSDIFDHLYAILPLFDLRAVQEPTSNDFSRFIDRFADRRERFSE
ncbi:MAG: mechanosensitive ion channel family protein [Zoogloeaceae bacterium]|jgi:miniconductance mechanosensitive channel|nr:mechanosensitive ion channel family protein [Zoogloeaceae bacterium]